MAGMGPLTLVLVMPLVLPLLAGVTDTVLKECYIRPSIVFDVTENKSLEASFWGNVKNVHPFMTMKLQKVNSSSINYLYVTFNLTHVDVQEASIDTTKAVSVKAMPGLVCQGWRLFRLVLNDSNFLTVTDDHNTTWIDREFSCSISNMTVTVDNFNSSCITLTPTWKVVKGTPVNMTLPSPRQQEDLRFTLQVEDRKYNAKPMFLIGSDTINLGAVLPGTPTRLRLKQTPGAVPGKVASNTREEVIEIGSTTSVGVNSSSDILIVQHLDHRACPPLADCCCCIPDFVLAILWMAAASSVVTFYSLRRICRLITNQEPLDSPQLRPPSPEAIYEEIIVRPWL